MKSKIPDSLKRRPIEADEFHKEFNEWLETTPEFMESPPGYFRRLGFAFDILFYHLKINIARTLWDFCEYFHIPLGKFAPDVFAAAFGIQDYQEKPDE